MCGANIIFKYHSSLFSSIRNWAHGRTGCQRAVQPRRE